MAGAYVRVRKQSVAFDPDHAAAQERLRLVDGLRKQDRRCWNIDPIRKLRIEVKTYVVRLRRFPQIAEQQKSVGRLRGITHDLGHELIETETAVVWIVRHVHPPRHGLWVRLGGLYPRFVPVS